MQSRYIVISSDPGESSGAIIRLFGDGKSIHGWWVWTKMTRKGTLPVFRLKNWTGDVAEFDRLPMLLEVVRSECTKDDEWYYLAIEGLFVPGRHQPMQVQGLLTLAESAGAIKCVFSDRYVGECERPLAREWRPRTAGIPQNTKKQEAEAKAIQYAEVLFSWPGGSRDDILTKAEKGAVCEAAFIGRDAWANKFATR